MDNAIPRSPQTPTVAEVRARVKETARITLPRPLDRTYHREIENYKQWVEQQRLVRDGKYITRDNVDLYFAEVQQHRLVKAATGRRVVNALQAYADMVEYTGAEDKFVVDSAIVVSMLQTQKQRRTQHKRDTAKDYHVNLPVKIFTYNEKRAQEARQEIDRQAQSVSQVQLDMLNVAAQRAFHMMVTKLETLQQQQAHHHQQLQQYHAKILQQQLQQQQVHEQQQQQLQELLLQQQQQILQQQQQIRQQQQQQEMQQLVVQQQQNNKDNGAHKYR
jgi:hypothetical protein